MSIAISGTASSYYSLASLKQTQQSPQERFAASDTDASGSLSLEEYQSFAPDFVEDIDASFTQIDSNGDNALTEEELKAFAETQGSRPPPPPPSSSNSISSILETLLLGESETDSEVFAALDTNQDGEVSADELSAAVEEIESSFTAILLSAQQDSVAA